MTRWAALLKGVNVGGNRKLPMAELKAFVEGLGFGEVATLLASGNVVFSAEKGDAAAIERQLEEEAVARLGLGTEFLLRSAADLETVLAANPFVEQAANRPNHLLVHFHRDPVPQTWVDAVTAEITGPERLCACNRELFVDYADGIGDSKLPPLMAKARFRRLNTARNWNTVVKLAALTARSRDG